MNVWSGNTAMTDGLKLTIRNGRRVTITDYGFQKNVSTTKSQICNNIQ